MAVAHNTGSVAQDRDLGDRYANRQGWPILSARLEPRPCRAIDDTDMRFSVIRT